MGVGPRTAPGAPQVQKNAPVANGTIRNVAVHGKHARYLDYLVAHAADSMGKPISTTIRSFVPTSAKPQFPAP
jgi:hypothetical protein